MMLCMSTPTPLTPKGGYWTTTWWDADGHRRTKRFGSVAKIGKRVADRKYAKWLTRWTADPSIQNPSREVLTVKDIADAYQKWADGYYVKPDGTPTGEAANVADALKHLTDLYGDYPAKKFRPADLVAVRQTMLHLSRTTINQRVNKIRRCWRWAVQEEMLPASRWHALQAVSPLEAGRTKAKEPKRREAVSDAVVDATLGKLAKTVRAMVEVQRWTGCRPGDLFVMRHMDIDRSGAIWLYRPQLHKTAHHGKNRTVYIGPRAQEVLTPFLGSDLTALVFTTKYGTAWNRRGYRQAVVRAAREAQVPEWSPYDLRHAAATRIRKEFGEEAARVVLGHAKLDTTQIYGAMDVEKAVDVMRRIG